MGPKPEKPEGQAGARRSRRRVPGRPPRNRSVSAAKAPGLRGGDPGSWRPEPEIDLLN